MISVHNDDDDDNNDDDQSWNPRRKVYEKILIPKSLLLNVFLTDLFDVVNDVDIAVSPVAMQCMCAETKKDEVRMPSEETSKTIL